MKLYIMLPFEYQKYISERVGTAGQLTPDYTKRFKDATFLYRKIIGDIAKDANCNPRTATRKWLYTVISPETFEPYEGKVGI